MKKRLCLLLCLIIAAACLTLLTACGGGDGKEKVMNLSLNPSVELILNGENRVLTANALNDEGNAVLASVELAGKTAEEAAALFLEYCCENGFDRAAGDSCALTITLSGDSADALYRSVKRQAERKIAALGATVGVKRGEDLDREDLEALVGHCMRELSAQALAEMTEERLLALLKESRTETAPLLTEELKEFYYSDRAFALQKAEVDACFDFAEAQGHVAISMMLPRIKEQVDRVEAAYEEYRAVYQQAFLAQDGAYRQRMSEYLQAKRALLSAHVSGLSEEEISRLKGALRVAEAALSTAKSAAESTVLMVDNSLRLAMGNALTALHGLLDAAGLQPLPVIEARVLTAKAAFKTSFESLNRAYTDGYRSEFPSAK